MIYKYDILIKFILLFVLVNIINNIENDSYYFRSLLLNMNNKLNSIIYLVNQNAGLANTLRGMSSTMWLSFFCRKRFLLKGWNSIIYYFDYPKILIYNKEKENSIIFFKCFNISVLTLLKTNTSIILTDIHGFINYITQKFIYSKEMNLIKKVYSLKYIDGSILNSIIHKEIFIPSKYIKKFISIFDNIKRNKKVLGIHIRSGKFKNNFTENYFIKYVKLKKYLKKSILVVKNNNISFIFSVSDNINNLKDINSYFKEVLINITFKGNIVHSKFALYNSHINNNAIRIVSEFILLSNCDIIIGTERSSYSAEACRRELLKKCYFI